MFKRESFFSNFMKKLPFLCLLLFWICLVFTALQKLIPVKISILKLKTVILNCTLITQTLNFSMYPVPLNAAGREGDTEKHFWWEGGGSVCGARALQRVMTRDRSTHVSSWDARGSFCTSNCFLFLSEYFYHGGSMLFHGKMVLSLINRSSLVLCFMTEWPKELFLIIRNVCRE